jgi:hypothetical protein
MVMGLIHSFGAITLIIEICKNIGNLNISWKKLVSLVIFNSIISY